MRKALVAVVAALAFSLGAIAMTTGTAGAGPTCSHLGVATHGQHIVGDYITGIGGLDGSLSWPPKGGIVGETIGGSGALLPGQSGIHLHSAAPGASFCTDSNSPGAHL